MTAAQIQPGNSICWMPCGLGGDGVTCDHPNVAPASTMRNRKNVLANVPFAVISRVPGFGTATPPAAAVAPVAPAPPPDMVSRDAPVAGEAQPASSSRASLNRFSLSAGFAMDSGYRPAHRTSCAAPVIGGRSSGPERPRAAPHTPPGSR